MAMKLTFVLQNDAFYNIDKDTVEPIIHLESWVMSIKENRLGDLMNMDDKKLKKKIEDKLEGIRRVVNIISDLKKLQGPNKFEFIEIKIDGSIMEKKIQIERLKEGINTFQRKHPNEAVNIFEIVNSIEDIPNIKNFINKFRSYIVVSVTCERSFNFLGNELGHYKLNMSREEISRRVFVKYNYDKILN